MQNRDIYVKDPSRTKLENDGVVNVNNANIAILRYELETFVCEGQYASGMERILDSFLQNIGKNQQPAVWISGFFGSGKSHLAKMLAALWTDFRFNDGTSARSIVNLPDSIKAQLVELNNAGKQYAAAAASGGLHAAIGTLNSGSTTSVRLSLLGIVFKSVGLPEDYQAGRFAMYLKKEGIYDTVKSEVEKSGNNWEEELDHFRLSSPIREVLSRIKPEIFGAPEATLSFLKEEYPSKIADISNDDMIRAIIQAVSKNDKMPLTIIVLDEIQQFIGGDAQRSIDVQTMVEACCTQFQSKLLFVGTGQMALSGTSLLQRLQGRFKIPVELLGNDVDEVIRKVILRKKPDAKAAIEQVMKDNNGEIFRHLPGTGIAPSSKDEEIFVNDYPILPVRHRFWSEVLQALDTTGTNSQLRSQLHMIHEAVQTNLDKPLSNMIPADFLYFNLGNVLLGSGSLPPNLWRQTIAWNETGTDDEKLKARACGLVFLIRKLAEYRKHIGIKATAETLSHLMVEDISEGSGRLAVKLSSLLEGCDLLMKIDDEYHIQTPESIAWNTEYRAEIANYSSSTTQIELERNTRLRAKFNEHFKLQSINQGNSKVTRRFQIVFESVLPPGADKNLTLWVRDGWAGDEHTVASDAKMEDPNSPVIFVFIPSRSSDDLRQHLINIKAAAAVLERKSGATTTAGDQARLVIESTKRSSERIVEQLLNDAVSSAVVYQSGGNEIPGGDLTSKLKEAAEVSLQRLYPQFNIGDNPNWDKVYEKAHSGSADSLKSVGDLGEAIRNPVCKAVYDAIGSGSKGADIRQTFMGSPYGWSQDAVDGAIQVLLVNGIIKAQNEQLKQVEARQLERRDIPRATFKIEAITITAGQRIKIRQPLTNAGISFKPNEESAAIPDFIQKLTDLCNMAGGEAPQPTRPNTQIIQDIRTRSGNEQLLYIHDHADVLNNLISDWTKAADKIEKRQPNWITLNRLLQFSQSLKLDNIRSQIDAIVSNRQLLDDPDPTLPLLTELTQILRDRLNVCMSDYEALCAKGEEKLEADENWKAIAEPDKKYEIRKKYSLVEAQKPQIKVSTSQEIIETLGRMNLDTFHATIDALPSRFDKVLTDAAKLNEPKIQEISVISRTLRTENDLDEWLAETRSNVSKALKTGPVIVR